MESNCVLVVSESSLVVLLVFLGALGALGVLAVNSFPWMLSFSHSNGVNERIRNWMAMTRMKGLWQVEETVQKYKNAWLEVSEDQVIRPDGKVGAFASVRMKPGVSVLALDDLAQVYLTIEYKYAVERDSIEVVSGGIDEDEPPPAAARRELREELGIEAAQWIDLGLIDPFTSAIHSPATLYLARKLSLVKPEPEGTEVIKVLKVDLSEAVRMVMESEITHGPSCVLILKTDHFLKSEKAGISK